MFDSLLYSINAVLPICLVMLLGKLLSKKLLTREFFVTCDKFVFNVALPVLLFQSVAEASVSVEDKKLFVFCTCGIFAAIIIPWITVPLFIKSNAKRGAFIQGVYRSNVAILGLPIAGILFGAEGTRKFSMVTSITIILFNISSVILLSVFAPKEDKPGAGKLAKKIFVDVVKNPLVIGSVLGVPFMLGWLSLPQAASTTCDYLGRVATPLALLSIGASVTFSKGDGRLKTAIVASSVKAFVMPAIATLIAGLTGFRGTDLGVVFILFAVPSAIASYIMAKSMKSDYILAGQIVMLTTVLCMISMFFGIFIMKNTGLI